MGSHALILKCVKFKPSTQEARINDIIVFYYVPVEYDVHGSRLDLQDAPDILSIVLRSLPTSCAAERQGSHRN